jgi:hypothetical protein
MMGIHFEKFILRLFHPCTNIVVCTNTNLDGTAYYTPKPYGRYCHICGSYLTPMSYTIYKSFVKSIFQELGCGTSSRVPA